MPMTIEEAKENPHWLTFGHNDFHRYNILREHHQTPKILNNALKEMRYTETLFTFMNGNPERFVLNIYLTPIN